MTSDQFIYRPDTDGIPNSPEQSSEYVNILNALAFLNPPERSEDDELGWLPRGNPTVVTKALPFPKSKTKSKAEPAGSESDINGGDESTRDGSGKNDAEGDGQLKGEPGASA
ncbi:hypothetical protein IEO21_00156 [Rhodonia placenta]|uniref:Uncharacterized protein n=1 Tax=Rhodonia placenta TaxID=104341 RepID=A0A8H7PCE4_9APHY|nr:hypothetical protein IEO21_00156 [Postia placenta]